MARYTLIRRSQTEDELAAAVVAAADQRIGQASHAPDTRRLSIGTEENAVADLTLVRRGCGVPVSGGRVVDGAAAVRHPEAGV